MTEGKEVSYVLRLTGSTFFDTVIRLRAREMVKKYPGLTLEERADELCFAGTLPPKQAEEFLEEME